MVEADPGTGGRRDYANLKIYWILLRGIPPPLIR